MILFIIIALVVIWLSVFLKFIDLGMNYTSALTRSFKFPLIAIILHYMIFKKYKSENIRIAIKLLFLPITAFPQVIVGIAEMFIEADAMKLAVNELLSEVNSKERNVLIRALSEQGVTVKFRKRKEPKVTNDMQVEKIYHFKTFLKQLRFISGFYENTLQKRFTF